MGHMGGLAQEAPSPCLLKASTQGTQTASPSPRISWGTGLALVFTLAVRLVGLASRRGGRQAASALSLCAVQRAGSRASAALHTDLAQWPFLRSDTQPPLCLGVLPQPTSSSVIVTPASMAGKAWGT